jgi:hypothetical protein
MFNSVADKLKFVLLLTVGVIDIGGKVTAEVNTSQVIQAINVNFRVRVTIDHHVFPGLIIMSSPDLGLSEARIKLFLKKPEVKNFVTMSLECLPFLLRKQTASSALLLSTIANNLRISYRSSVFPF